MLEKILPYERDLFFLINSSHTNFWDNVMWLFSGSIIWIPIILFFLISLVYKKKWKEWLPVLIAIGILSAELGYMLLSVWQNILGMKQEKKSLVIMPVVNTENKGMALAYTF